MPNEYPPLDELQAVHRASTEARVRRFMQERSIRYVLALTGDSSDASHLRTRNELIISDFLTHLQEPTRYAILTSGTKTGVSYLGTTLAREHGIATIAVRPMSCAKYARTDAPDFVIETPDLLYGRTTFSAETPTFVNMTDGAVVIGGSYGTLVEASTMLKINKSRTDAIRRSPQDSTLQRPIAICPIAKTRGVADLLTSIELYEDIGECLPTPRNIIADGANAAAFVDNYLRADTDNMGNEYERIT